MNSISARLFTLILLATTLVWSLGMAWIYSGSKLELERVLDARLEEATRMVNSLIDSADFTVTNAVSGVRVPNRSTAPVSGITDFKLACQVWSIDGRLVGKSSAAPNTQLTQSSSGFSNQDINGTHWRVYAREDRERGVRVLVGDNIAHRERLVRELIWGLAVPGIVVLAVLSGLIWIAIRQGLAPLSRLTHVVERRSGDELEPIEIGSTASEIRPVVDALNGHLQKVIVAREHERSVTAFAAHELRTPLAGLRTQVQIALAAADPAMRDAALKNALVAADRTTRMARQLLSLAQIDAGAGKAPQDWIDAGTRLRAICDELRTKENTAPATVDDALYGCRIRVNPDAFHLAARNLTENAIQHSRSVEPVRWTLVKGDKHFAIALDDGGPGIPDDEIGMVTKRFFRGRHKCAVGSGLGLSIVETALDKDGLSLRLENRHSPAGLRASILIDAARIELQARPRAGEPPAGAVAPASA
ncbi:MAG: sensor histidine kinase N-terminal domain-containing protein [Hyphomicrobium sp.]|jgi:two-component system sensor histidine kinase QseC|uniref:ATP-binding protein n=1 Tax=Hyphomicrobium sp. TaxID=82 RepID=UPI0025BF7D4F|nr:ATP-binding protein [Hyphomicrobium sp.]MBX9862916.1 sensor histidine kinase N-terminal domain-containing protein [Hyphomicrobium sp.]